METAAADAGETAGSEIPEGGESRPPSFHAPDERAPAAPWRGG